MILNRYWIALFALTTSFISNFAFAESPWIRVHQNRKDNHPAVCRLAIYKTILKLNIPVTQLGICSGTLIAPNVVATAAHCLKGSDKIRVDCGFVKQAPESMEALYDHAMIVDEYLDHRFFQESFNGIKSSFIETNQDKDDFGFVVLDRPAKIKPMLIPEFSEKLEFTSRFMRGKDKHTECRMSGFGMNNIGTSGVQNTVRVDPSDLRISKSRIISRKSLEYADFGDSGGALYCRKNQGEWYLIGVISTLRQFKLTLNKKEFFNTFPLVESNSFQTLYRQTLQSL